LNGRFRLKNLCRLDVLVAYLPADFIIPLVHIASNISLMRRKAFSGEKRLDDISPIR